jgi:F-type H+-transporting ATPase subunit gamma
MPSLKDIRKRIGSVKNTQKITRAMKLVAAAKLRRAQQAMERQRPYATHYREMLVSLVSQSIDDPQSPHPLLERRAEVKCVALLMVASDRGMCGGFNANVLKQSAQYAKARTEDGAQVKLFPLGRRAIQFAGRSQYDIGESFGECISAGDQAGVRDISRVLIDGFTAGDFDEVVVISNRFKSVIAQTPVALPVLPVGGERLEEEAASNSGMGVDLLYEPDQVSLLGHVVPRYIEVLVREAGLESIAGEHAARMNAMNNATDNASEMISSLTLQMNRARQAAITKELMEIIGGAEALK